MIRPELTEDDVGKLRGAIDFVVKHGGMQAARQLIAVDDKLIKAFEDYESSLKQDHSE